MADTVTIRPAETAADLAAVRQLCWDYWTFLAHHSDVDRRINETFYPRARYETLLEKLGEIHARPEGLILLAVIDGAPAACGMSQKIDAQTSEIKRVFVDPSARGRGLAQAICTRLMDQAAEDGFERVVLDTSRMLTAAQALYERLGFRPRGPYQTVPDHILPELRFFEYTHRTEKHL